MIPFWEKTGKHSKPQSAQKRRQNAKPAVPRTAQQSIPMQRMFEDGTCRVRPGYYTRTIQYQDINYQLAQQEDKTAIFEEWCSFLNFFDSSIKFELSFVNMATDSAEFEIACHHGCRDGTSRFKRLRHIILRGRCGSKWDHVEILHFLCEKIHRLRGVSACHERRRKRDQPFGGWRRKTGVLPVIDGPELQHVTDRRHHADAPAGLWKSIRHCAEQLPIDIDRTAAHPLRDAFCLIDQGPGYFHQHQISAGRALAFHNPQHVDIEGFNLRTMNDCFGIAMHTLLYF